MNHHATILLLAGALVGAAFQPSGASACSGVACNAPRLVAGEFVEIPANAPGLAVDTLNVYGEVGELSAQLFDMTSGEAVLVEVEVFDGLVVPVDGFVEGATYQLDMSSLCGETPFDALATIHVTEAAPLPETLGWVQNEVTVSEGDVPAPESGGTCYATIQAAYADVTVQLDPAVQPWAQLLVWETVVDGLAYQPTGTISPRNGYGLPGGYVDDPAGSWVGRGRDRIFTRCERIPATSYDEGVGGGGHDVSFRAYIPGTDIWLETTPGFVDLRCGSGTGFGPDCGPTGTPDPVTGECMPIPDSCPPGSTYDPEYSECPGYYGDDYGYYDDTTGLFFCSATGAPASGGNVFGFGFLMLGALVAFRRRR